ncbi:MAG: PPC domain-containing DNA-binding protein [Planctomycetota bacterium]
MKALFPVVCSLWLCACATAPATVAHAFRLKPGQDLKREIQAYAASNGIEAAWVATCVGSLSAYHLRFADRETGSRGAGHFEILALTGTVSGNGSHLHLALGDEDGRVVGGHLLDGCLVYTTAEIVLVEATDLVFTRAHDGSTKWQELQIGRRTAKSRSYLPASAQ